jgi:hypothetical protein
MQDLMVITVALVVVVGGFFIMWTVGCVCLKVMFKIADKVFGV